MQPWQRQECILERLGRDAYVSVAQATELLAASPATVRRDFAVMAQAGLVSRVRGGVRRRHELADGDPFEPSQPALATQKVALARRAAELVQPDTVLFVDGGTTTFPLAHALPLHALRVVTNSVRLALALEQRQGEGGPVKIFLAGGFLQADSGILLGPYTEASLGQYHADLAILSAGGIDTDGVSNTNELIMETERIMIRNARRVVLLADHTKIGRHAMCHVAGLEEIDVLITDVWPANEPLLADIAAQNVDVLVVAVDEQAR